VAKKAKKVKIKTAPKLKSAKTKKSVKQKSVKQPTKKIIVKAKSKKAIAKVATKLTPKSNAKPAAFKTIKTAAPKWQQFLSPLDDRLLVEVQEGEKRTAGGLYIPNTAVVAGHKRGLVVAAGPGHKNKKGKIRPMDVKAGDTVVFSEFVGTKLNLMGVDVQLLRETEILGIVEG
jgi:chaperonin GroES